MKPLVLFGVGAVARMAHYLWTNDSPREVVACTVDRDFLSEEARFGLPVVPFDEVVNRYPPGDFDMFVAVGYSRMNRYRAERFRQAKDLGYALPSYVSSRATIWPDLVLGENCFVMEDALVQPFVIIGDDVILWSACNIGHESVIGDHCFVASHAVIAGLVNVEPNCFIGANSTIRDGITIGRECVIGAGAVVMKSTEARGVYAAPRAQQLALPSDQMPGL
jgi:sugar O-acyltransferase (sialic acid O-acetyltransferase NeuD family)